MNASTTPSTRMPPGRGSSIAPQAANARTAATPSTTPSAPPSERKRQAFGRELPRDASAAGAQRGAHGEFRLPARRAREQQARDVDARNEQEHADRGHEHQQRLAHLADDGLVDRRGGDGGPSGVLRILARQPFGDRGQLVCGAAVP